MLASFRAAALALAVGASVTLVSTTAAPVPAATTPPRPVITKVKPNTGPSTGGTMVTIKGKHLQTAKKVLFGKAKGKRLKVVSDRKLKVLTPAHAAGTVTVKVKTRGGASKKVAAARFTFVVTKPDVTAVSPTSGPTSGGTPVTVTGTGFVAVSAVTFDGVPGTFTVQSPTQLTVTSPAHPGAFAVHVNVTTPAGTSPSKTGDRFTYVATGPPPVVEAVDPLSGPAAGGAVVTVTGTGLSGASAVTFGGSPGSGVHVVSDTELEVTSPAHAAGSVQVQVTTPGGLSADVPEDDFEFLAPDTRAYAAPLPGDADTDGQGAFLNAVDCPAVQECFAVGGYLSGGQRLPLAEQRVGTDGWQPYSPQAPADVGTGTDTSLDDVDCVSPTFCVAVGTYQDDAADFLPYVETWNGEEWSPATAASLPDDLDATEFDERLLADVECTSVTHCVAVGRYHESVSGASVPLLLELSGGQWNSVDVVDPGTTGELNAVDCPSAASCVAVGQDTTAQDLPLAVSGPGTWADQVLALPANADATPNAGLVDVSCSAVGSCVAAGSYRDFTNGVTAKVQGLVERLTGTTWTPDRAAIATSPTGAANQPNVVIHDVSCASTCSVVGEYTANANAGDGLRPFLVRFNGTTPVVQRGLAPDETGGQLNSSTTTVVCGGGSRCLGSGYYDDGSGAWTPLLQHLDAGAWAASNGPVPADSAGILKPVSSDLDGTVGIAVGYYNDAGGNQLALLMLDLPV